MTTTMKDRRITTLLYFIVHFLVEIVCFALLSSEYPVIYAAITALAYDALAFAPQGPLGELIHKFRKVPFATIAVLMMGISIFLFGNDIFLIHLAGLVLLSFSNAILHEYGAIETVRDSGGKLAPAAIFVSGGSFGVVIGKFYRLTGLGIYWLLILVALIEVLMIILSIRSKRLDANIYDLPKFNVCRTSIPSGIIVLAAFFVTAIRGYIGYAIPTSWCKETPDFFILFFLMGLGKALGGVLADKFGAGRVGVVSTLACIPFLIFGRDVMVISVFGVMLFSMTMAITYGMCLNAMPSNPGISFGVTTIGLFIGTLPTMFIRPSVTLACVLVTVLSVVCSVIMLLTLKMKKEK